MSIGAVLPLKATGSYGVDDLNRAHILFKSLSVFAEPGLIQEFYVVVPDSEVELVKETFARWQDIPIIVVAESTLLPELNNYPKMRGWRKQQLIKIAAANLMKSQFYLTFDADIVALKTLTKDKLIIDGKALLQYEPRSRHPKWWKASARLLKMSAKVGDTSKGMSVTPAILATDICKALMSELTPKNGKKTWAEAICDLHVPSHPRNWRLSSFLKLKWTEYSLYYLCAHKKGLINRYHVDAETIEVPQRFFTEGGWTFDSWDTAVSFSDQSPDLFCIIGSKTRIDPKIAWEKVAPFVDSKDTLF